MDEALGTTSYIVRRRLQSKAGETVIPAYEGLPIYGYYQKTSNIKSSGKAFSPDEDNRFTRLGDAEYWRPFQALGIPVDIYDDNWFVYNVGDAAAPINQTRYRLTNKSEVNISRAADEYYSGRKWSGSTYTVGETRVAVSENAAAQGFRATSKFRPFPGETRGVLGNPYHSTKVQVWVRVSDTSQIPKEYWYHPFEQFFYAFPSSDAYSGLVDLSLSTISENLGRSLANTKGTDLALDAAQESMRTALVKLLVRTGKTQEAAETEINKLIAFYRNTSSTGEYFANSPSANPSQPGSSVPSSSSPSKGLPSRNTTNNGISKVVNPLVTTLTIRGAFGIAGPSTIIDDRGNKAWPQMVQYYSNDVLNKIEPRRFDFKFPPQQIAYSSIGSEWTEIPRAGRVAFVDWSSYRLMKISFQFVIGNPDSLDDSIDNELQTLRLMATTPFPVVIICYYDLFSQQLQ